MCLEVHSGSTARDESTKIKGFLNMQPTGVPWAISGRDVPESSPSWDRVSRCKLRQEENMANGAIAADQKAALERLIQVALGDTGQSRKVANFRLAWWNAEECGGFDLTDLWRVDTAIAADMVTVFSMVA